MVVRDAPVTLPRQDRSRRTADRIGRAMLRLLERKPLDEIGVAELCELANASISSFYARFHDKSAVLIWLEEHYYRDSEAAMADTLGAERWEGVPLVAMVHELMEIYVAFLREHLPVLRAVALEVRLRPGSPIAARSRELNQQSYERFASLLLARRWEIPHPDPGFAVRYGLVLIFAASHELVLFADVGMHPVRLPPDDVATQLAETFLRTLHVEP